MAIVIGTLIRSKDVTSIVNAPEHSKSSRDAVQISRARR